MLVKLLDDLRVVYTRLRDKYQVEIDKAFDRVSRQIGYVVATAIPVVLEVGGKGKPNKLSITPQHLKGTLFDKELTAALGPMADDPIPLGAGTYSLYLIWRDALKLRLRTDWIEPAHYRRPGVEVEVSAQIARMVGPRPEPVHWFDPGISLAAEEAVVISVIDEVYPELRLAERVSFARRLVPPEVKEPAHVRPGLEPGPERAAEVLKEISAMLRRFGY